MIKWYDVYREIALLLSKFYSLNKTSAGQVLFKRAIDKKNFSEKNRWLIRLKTISSANSIDPIHIFSSLNESNINLELRKDRINGWLELLDSKNVYEQIEFTGCPAPFSLKILSARKLDSQKEIWAAFSEVIKHGQEGLSEEIFKKFPNWYGVEISSFTIFLFWVDSANFMPLDKNSNRILLEVGAYKVKPKNYKEYSKVLFEKNTDFYRETALLSFDYRTNHSEELLFERLKKALHFSKEKGIKSLDFKIIGVSVGANSDSRFSKVLTTDKIYTFYAAFNFTNPELIQYDKELDPRIYNLNGVDINISAIVGKNGSGKSTITELIYLILNNLTKRVLEKKCNLKLVDRITAELYYFTTTVYKIKISPEQISVHEFLPIDGKYKIGRQVKLDKNFLNEFFYSIAINYSHYALNSLEVGEWINKVFHKNDAYQIPLVINPMRIEGNIDINSENNLISSRLLSNILDVDPALRVLTENKRKANKLKLTLNYGKVRTLSKDPRNGEKFPKGNVLKNTLEKVYTFFEIPQMEKTKVVEVAEKYIYKKLVLICKTYPHYKKYYSIKSRRIYAATFENYLHLLSKDNSHITYKLKQAINFLKYDHLKFMDLNSSIDIEDLAGAIENVMETNLGISQLNTIDLIL